MYLRVLIQCLQDVKVNLAILQRDFQTLDWNTHQRLGKCFHDVAKFSGPNSLPYPQSKNVENDLDLLQRPQKFIMMYFKLQQDT